MTNTVGMEPEQWDKDLASLILDQDQWECGCEKCHQRLAGLIAQHRIHHRAKALSDLAEGDGPWI